MCSIAFETEGHDGVSPCLTEMELVSANESIVICTDTRARKSHNDPERMEKEVRKLTKKHESIMFELGTLSHEINQKQKEYNKKMKLANKYKDKIEYINDELKKREK